ncbi:nicotinate-nucleotide--dimethylbenzimidazole phosphoribosyltransferase [Methylocaldum szegediense]|uniref:Nicotinate-nucleotide--dimethylbenzimidazole phosphoribosyltransferase n=1 Tax=Methylocaldum szegediense TaxID=73780 RepID=A0ABM9HZK3_9GAMM|nr:nicotinate-nucleotide--dimethylbenzimidazole phosphoribosyltransferase [Methylocaldum szegediense]CAI8792886.1 Nicotinate-nucleotide--dimethylbenzimidazole phosphoribosyltransferase [Methylocaldum szegediense]
MNSDLAWLKEPVARPDENAARLAAERQAMLIKPPGALGRLEALAIRLAAWQRTPKPTADRVRIVVFAGDHGVTEEGVSAFPQSVTAAMVNQFARGGAAISVLARTLGAELEVINLGTVEETGSVPGVLDLRLGLGTANFLRGPAMTERQLAEALRAGRDAAARASSAGIRIFIGGEMGIGNTTAAAALGAALLGETPEALAGPGAGLDTEGVRRKAEIIRRALDRHGSYLADPLEVLRRLGGFEIAALAGAFVTCAQRGLPVLVDGFICTAAALAAERLCPRVSGWFLYAHASAEPGHARMLAALDGKPLLDLGMRLGEGSGAAVALPLLRLVCTLHAGMATFEEAGIAGKSS